MELRKLCDYEIERAIIHVVDRNTDEAILNNSELELSQRTLEFVGGHLAKLFTDKNAIKGKLLNEESTINKATNRIIENEEVFTTESKTIAEYTHKVMRQYPSLPSGDILIVKLNSDGIPLVAIIILEYVNAVGHVIGHEDGEFIVKLDFMESMLKMPSRTSYGAVLQGEQKELLAVERITNNMDREPIEFFFKEVLNANRTIDNFEKTVLFYEQTEKWIRKNIKNEVELAIGLREELEEIFRNQIEIQAAAAVEELTEDKEKIEKLLELLEVAGMDTKEPFELDKPFLEKKLKSKAINTDTGFMIKGVTDLYQDPSKFEIKYNGDGTVNYIIKNVRNISQR